MADTSYFSKRYFSSLVASKMVLDLKVIRISTTYPIMTSQNVFSSGDGIGKTTSAFSRPTSSLLI